jgi:hypothetical protein
MACCQQHHFQTTPFPAQLLSSRYPRTTAIFFSPHPRHFTALSFFNFPTSALQPIPRKKMTVPKHMCLPHMSHSSISIAADSVLNTPAHSVFRLLFAPWRWENLKLRAPERHHLPPWKQRIQEYRPAFSSTSSAQRQIRHTRPWKTAYSFLLYQARSGDWFISVARPRNRNGYRPR